jgi:hypothetical protein
MATTDPYAQVKRMHEQGNDPEVVRACHTFIARSDVAPACFEAAAVGKTGMKPGAGLLSSQPRAGMRSSLLASR